MESTEMFVILIDKKDIHCGWIGLDFKYSLLDLFLFYHTLEKATEK